MVPIINTGTEVTTGTSAAIDSVLATGKSSICPGISVEVEGKGENKPRPRKWLRCRACRAKLTDGKTTVLLDHVALNHWNCRPFVCLICSAFHSATAESVHRHAVVAHREEVVPLVLLLSRILPGKALVGLFYC